MSAGARRRPRGLRGRRLGAAGARGARVPASCSLAAARAGVRGAACHRTSAWTSRSRSPASTRALRLQHRSVLNYSLVAGSVIGLEYQAHAEKMRDHARSELEDATRLVEKISALGGEPTTDVAPLGFDGRPGEGAGRADRLRGRDARGAPGGDRAHRAGGGIGGRGAPARAHDHAQAGAGRLPAAGPPAALDRPRRSAAIASAADGVHPPVDHLALAAAARSSRSSRSPRATRERALTPPGHQASQSPTCAELARREPQLLPDGRPRPGSTARMPSCPPYGSARPSVVRRSRR